MCGGFGALGLPDAELFVSGKPVSDVRSVLPLEQARIAHEMLAGALHERGKIVLSIAA